VVKKILSPSHAGLRNWLLQRVTALVMALYLLVAAASLAVQQPVSYQAWRALFALTWVRLATLLFMASLLLHAWLGVRDILNDYVSSLSARMALQRLAGTVLLLEVAWTACIVWGI
jgi:succinate dehydrogenase / fumarate reductase membrane anchor subunit